MSYADLIDGLEKLEGFDRELDLEIGLTVGGWRMDGRLVYVPEGETSYVPLPGGMYPSFTDSLDAAVALVERVLPGWRWAMTTAPGHTAASVRDKSILAHDKIEGAGYHPTPAIALLIATLKALSQEPSK